jgi:uncharacterized protein YrrD
MIKGNELIGRTVVDMEAATRVGKIKEIILQRDGERVAGFVIAKGETIVGTGGTRRIIPASALHAIGPDAITVHSVKEGTGTEELNQLPRMSDVVGHKMVTRSGRVLGTIDDLLVDGTDGKVIGFAVGESMRSKLENIFQPERSKIHGYVRADADLQVGNDLIVVPDDALIEGEPDTREPQTKPIAAGSQEIGSGGWAHPETGDAPRRSIWTRRTDPATSSSIKTPMETASEPVATNATNPRRAVPIESEPVTRAEPARRAEP